MRDVCTRGLLIAALFALGACGGPTPDRIPAGYSDTRQQPSNYEPGVHVSGYANIGVVRRF